MISMEMYEAIPLRRSNRKFASSSLPEDLLTSIQKKADGAERLYGDIDMRITMVRDGSKVFDIMSGLVGNLGKVRAPHYLVVTSEEKPGYGENAGFVLEHVVLEMTRMGLATCWLGAHVEKADLDQALGFNGPHVPVIIVAFGLPQDVQSLYRKSPKDAKRKDLSQIVFGSLDEAWKDIFEAVRIAPSAGNSQPWRFYIAGDRIDMFIGKGNAITQKLFSRLNRIDAGIALCHLKIAAKKGSKSIELRKIEGVEKAEHTYITSIIKKN
jgi:nitroreductase